MLKKSLLVAAIGLVLVFSLSFFLPKEFEVSRQTEIHAPANSVFSLIGDLRNWKMWTSWAEKDPSLQYTYGETTTGVGGNHSWQSSRGAGSIRILEFQEDSHMAYELTLEGWNSKAKGAFDLIPSNEGYTVVKWSVRGSFEGHPVRRLMSCLFDYWIGRDFERGLQNLKGKVETAQGGANKLDGDAPTTTAPLDGSAPQNAPSPPQ